MRASSIAAMLAVLAVSAFSAPLSTPAPDVHVRAALVAPRGIPQPGSGGMFTKLGKALGGSKPKGAKWKSASPELSMDEALHLINPGSVAKPVDRVEALIGSSRIPIEV